MGGVVKTIGRAIGAVVKPVGDLIGSVTGKNDEPAPVIAPEPAPVAPTPAPAAPVAPPSQPDQESEAQANRKTAAKGKKGLTITRTSVGGGSGLNV